MTFTNYEKHKYSACHAVLDKKHNENTVDKNQEKIFVQTQALQRVVLHKKFDSEKA